MSCPAQQAPLRRTASPWSYSGSVTPITSAPVCTASAAVTELSTPPDMATTIRASLAGRTRSNILDILALFTRISLLTPSQVAREGHQEGSVGALRAGFAGFIG